MACILNGRRCGRTHCRYTGPYYLAMIAPVIALGFISSGIYVWITLGSYHRRRKLADLVGHRACMGKVLVATAFCSSLFIRSWRKRYARELAFNVAYWPCAPKARIISGGRFHPESCRLIR